ncbi:MAG TPA: serine protease [Thiomicrospira sp.]|jgi:NTE family protein|nr:serine protease [Thiomicrospira sp.]
MASSSEKSVSLVLGSGGARGLAHIGVIRWLEENNYKIQSISGSSIGALIGGLYACGKMDEYESWLKGMGKTDFLALMDIAWNRSGLIRGDKLVAAIKKLIDEPNIEDLPISFTAVATDINHEKEVWLQKGSLLDAMRASFSLPMIFMPYKHNGLTLIDGGVLNPIPIAPTFGENCDLTIAVNLGGKPKVTIHHNEVKETQKTSKDDGWIPSLYTMMDSIKEYFRSDTDPLKTPFSWDVYDISNKAFDSMQNSIARQQLAAYPPDITIEIPRNACGMLEFSLVDKMVKLGYERCQEELGDKIEDA